MTWFLDKEFLDKLDLRAYDAGAIAKRLKLDREIVAAFVDPKRRYMVETSEEYGWLAGANAEGQPTLVFLGAPRLSGEAQELVNIVSFDLAKGTISTRSLSPSETVLEDGELLLEALDEAIGFTHVGNAPVLAFKHPKLWHYAVVPFPFHLHDAVVGESDEEDDLELAREWIEEGSFVLHCGNAYFMSADGEVTSS